MNERRRHTGLYPRFENVKRRCARRNPRFHHVKRRCAEQPHSRFDNKRRRCAGETLSEVLYSMLVVALAVLILTGAGASSAKVDARSRSAFKLGHLEPIPASFPAPILSLRFTRADGVSLDAPIHMNLQRVDGKNLYHYDAP